MTSDISNADLSKNFEEINVPVPWGAIAVKAWGPKTGKPLVGVHGWLDNAGTFDLLAPLLPKDIRFVCIDLPGHGKSSHIPKGLVYFIVEGIFHIQRVIDHFGWKTFDYIGHSMGGGLGIMLAGVFQNSINKLISIDLIKLLSTKEHDLPAMTENAYKRLMAVEKTEEDTEPAYSYEEALERIIKGHNGSLSEEHAKIMLERGTKPHKSGKGLCFSRDLRLAKVFGPINLSKGQLKTYSERVKCEFMFIKASKGPYYEPKEVYEEFMEIYKKGCKSFRYEEVDGTHHAHLSNPNQVARIVNEFLSQ